MCCPVYGMVHIKEPLLLIKKCIPCNGGRGFPPSLSEWSFTIRPTPYNRKQKLPSCHPFITFIKCIFKNNNSYLLCLLHIFSVLGSVGDPQLVYQRPKYVLSCLWNGSYNKNLLLLIGKFLFCFVVDCFVFCLLLFVFLSFGGFLLGFCLFVCLCLCVCGLWVFFV